MQSFWDETLFRMGFSPEENYPTITFLGRKAVKVEGHKGILSLSKSLISFRYVQKTMVIEGENLSVCEISPDELFVRGNILNVGVKNE